MLKLDLTFKGKLDSEIKVLSNKIVNQSRTPFTQIVSKLSEPMKGSINWWVEGPSSRNPITSPFFHYYCAFSLVDELIEQGYTISEIVVDSFAFKKILKQYFQLKRKPIIIKYKDNTLLFYFKQLIIPFFKIFRTIYYNMYKYISAKKTKYLKKIVPNSPLTLIDIFAVPGHISKDRYYNGLLDTLTFKEKETIFFVPTLVFIPMKNLISAFKELRISDRNFLIKEDYLKVSDILFSLGHIFKLLNFRIKPIIVFNIDISSLVREELISMKGYPNAVEGLLNYRFAKRLNEQKIKLRQVINWFENQVVDKGWNAGFNKYYSNSPTIGYKGFHSIYQYLCAYPSEIENRNCILPSTIAVVGDGLVESTKEFASNLKIEIAPAFRFHNVWNERTAKPNPHYFTIVVALSIFQEDSIHLLNQLIKYMNSTITKKMRIWVKAHPVLPIEKIKAQVKDWPNSFNIVYEDFSKIIIKTDLMISSASSTSVEALAYGVPVLVVNNNSFFNYNTIPNEIPKVLWRVCQSLADLENAIDFYRDRSDEEIKEYKKIGLKIRKNYFSTVTKESVRKFLLLD